MAGNCLFDDSHFPASSPVQGERLVFEGVKKWSLLTRLFTFMGYVLLDVVISAISEIRKFLENTDFFWAGKHHSIIDLTLYFQHNHASTPRLLTSRTSCKGTVFKYSPISSCPPMFMYEWKSLFYPSLVFVQPSIRLPIIIFTVGIRKRHKLPGKLAS